MSGPSDLTQTIRKLSIPVDGTDDPIDESFGTALLVCRDKDSRKWGPRWLSQSGMQVTAAPDPENALQVARSTTPDVIFVDAALMGAGGEAIYQTLLDAADLEAAVIVLCTNAREISGALDAGAFDIARKPFDWRTIAQRANRVMTLKSRQATIEKTNKALSEALNVANTARKRLRSQQSFEPVTGLPNRSKFVDLLQRGMRAVDRDGNTLAVIVIGFTRFRLVIEAMGQEQADRILTEIGRRLAECLRDSPNCFNTMENGLRTAAIASLDSFRFGLMMTQSSDDEALTTLHQRLLDALSQPIQINGQTVHLSACLGVALYPQDADDVDSLLQRADNAMRDAQSRGGGFKYYCTETDLAAARKLRIEHMLHEALEREDLTLAYQPIFDVASGKLVAAEALLRWQQQDGSWIRPDEFIAVAEESGLMVRTGRYALDRACRQLAEWRRDGLPIPRISVNVAKVQLMSSGFANTVNSVLEEYEIDPCSLDIEISERGVLSGDYDVINQLRELKQLGVNLSLDDFGTGDSAIAYLKELPVDTLKIDRSYISGIAEDGKDAAIASAMVALGQRLELTVIAEGVETEAQLAALRELGCDAYQGFLSAKPLDPETFARRAGRLSKKAK